MKFNLIMACMLMASCTHRTHPSVDKSQFGVDSSKDKTQAPHIVAAVKPVKDPRSLTEEERREQEEHDAIFRLHDRDIKLLKDSVIAKADFYVKIAVFEGVDKIVLQFKKTDKKDSFYEAELPVAVPHKITYLANGQQLFVSTKDAEGKWSYSGEQGTPLPAFEELRIDLDGMVIPGKNVGTNNPILFRVIKGFSTIILQQNPDCLYDFYDNVRDNPCMVVYASGDNAGSYFTDNKWPQIMLHQHANGSIERIFKREGKLAEPKFPDDELIRNALVLKVYMEFID